MTDARPDPEVDALLEKEAQLERELLDVERTLGTVGAGTPRPGPHLVVEAGGHRALLEAAGVVQIARLVTFTPIPDAPPAVLGGFVRRGRQGVAIDLARVLGSEREPELDAHFIVLGGPRLLGILVDCVRHIVEAPVRVDAATERLLPTFRSDLVSSWCDVGGWILPLVSVHAIERLALGREPGGGERT
jgi:chemotaxis signal transduction protein